MREHRVLLRFHSKLGRLLNMRVNNELMLYKRSLCFHFAKSSKNLAYDRLSQLLAINLDSSICLGFDRGV